MAQELVGGVRAHPAPAPPAVRHLFIALDLEYVAHASTDVRHRPMSNGDWYEHLRTYVNRADVLQIGLALAFEEAHPVGGREVVANSS